jgi:hypothetical protein
MHKAVTRSQRLGLAVAIVSAGVLVAAAAQPASAGAPIGVVSANPADWTPRLPNLVSGVATYAFTQFNGIMYAGGAFSSVNNTPRSNIVAFDATTGALLASFAPNVNGEVWGLAADATGLYVGGKFTQVNGSARRGIAKLNLTTGAVDPTFTSPLNNNVSDVKLSCGRLFVGGTFTRKLEALNPTTGADTG